MNLNPQTEGFINLTLQVLLGSLWIAIPILMLLSLMYIYRRYKKWSDKEIREAERIIVKRNQEITDAANTINVLTPKLTELKLEVEQYEAKLLELKVQAGENPEEASKEPQDTINYKMTIKELQALAKDRNIKGYTRMSKAKLIDKLRGV